MGKSGSNAPAPAALPVKTPDIDTATAAATKALDAQSASLASQSATDEATSAKKRPGIADAAPAQAGQPPRPKKQMDPGSMLQAPVGGMNASAVLTG